MSAHRDGQRIDVGAQREARRPGAEGGDDAGARDRMPEGDVQRLQLLLQVRAGAILLERQLRTAVQRPATSYIVWARHCKLGIWT